MHLSGILIIFISRGDIKIVGLVMILAIAALYSIYTTIRNRVTSKIELYNDFSSNVALKKLIKEYMSTLPFAIDYQHPDQELENLGEVYGEAGGGALFVAHIGNEYAGCVALKDIGQGRCEMKRLYVREKYRGDKVGKKLAQTIVARAKEMGYTHMYLDTHREAQKLAIIMYKKMGFVECADYHENPGKLLCLELDLRTESNLKGIA